MSQRKPPEEGNSSEEAEDFDILESQDTSDRLVKSSALNWGKWAASLTTQNSSQGVPG